MRLCPMCQKNEPSKRYMKPSAWNNRNGIELRKCISCGFVYSAQSLYDYSNAGREYIPATRTDLLKKAENQRLPQFYAEILAKTKLTGGKLLDFGCGPGLGLLTLQQQNFEPFGIDSCKAFLAKHEELGITSAESLNKLNPTRFDLIVMKDVLEHVDHPVPLLQELLSYLRPGGYFYLRVPNVYHYPFHWSIDTKSHINHFAPQQIFTLFDRNGIEFVDFIDVYDISSQAGKVYHACAWPLRKWVPLYHQISVLGQKKESR